METVDKGRIIKLTVSALLIIALFLSAFKTFETVNAGNILVIQYPNGTLEVHNTPGIKPQWFGTLTVYKKSSQYWFSNKKEAEDGDIAVDESIKTLFNDGGIGNLSGSCRIDLPMDKASMITLHTKYGSQEAINHALVRTVMEKAVFLTGPLMSSKESSSTRRTDLLNYISDQAEHGVYKTRTVERKSKEEGSDSTKIISVVEILKDKEGNYLRQEKSPFALLNIGFGNLAINDLVYDPKVQKQITSQQDLTMQVQTAIAKAKTAEQQTFTTQKEGEALAAKAKWAQETIKAQKVTEAEQQLAVQQLAEKRSLSYRQEQINIGQGIAERKRLEMSANGALDAKLDAYVKVQQAMWKAVSEYQGNLVPVYQTGNGSTSNGLDYMQLMGMKAARDLGLDLNVKKQ